MAIIVDPDNHQIIDVSGLKLLFSLTNAESEVCRLMVTGHTTTEIADIRGTKPGSIRKQINSLLTKTNTMQRSKVVHLVFLLICWWIRIREFGVICRYPHLGNDPLLPILEL